MKPAVATPARPFPLHRPAKRPPRWARGALLPATVAVDAAAASLCLWLAFLVRFEGVLPQPNWAAARLLWLPIMAALLGSYHLAGLYLRRRGFSRAEIGSMVVRGNVFWLFTSFAIAYVYRTGASPYPTAVIVLSAALNAALSYWIHLGWEHLRKTHLDPPARVRRAVVIGGTPEARRLLEAAAARRAVVTGGTPEARRLLEAAAAKPGFAYTFTGGLEERQARVGDGGAWELGRLVQEEQVEEVILADPNHETRQLLHYMVQCAGLDVRLRVVPSVLELVRAPGRVTLVAGVPLVDVFGDEVPTLDELGKRLFDLAAACLGLALTLPLWPLIALAIRLSSPGPVWYRQERVGLHGRGFQMLKFRTMRADAEARTGPVVAALDDHRVTRVGRLLRRSRLDELPQLVNVLVGDMSLVGPRPERPYFVRQFLKSVPAYVQRYSVRPGITGLAQVRGAYDISARNKVRYDLVYLENRSFLLDLKILAQTVGVVLSGRGAR